MLVMREAGAGGAPGAPGTQGQRAPNLTIFVRTIVNGGLVVDMLGNQGGPGGKGAIWALLRTTIPEFTLTRPGHRQWRACETTKMRDLFTGLFGLGILGLHPPPATVRPAPQPLQT